MVSIQQVQQIRSGHHGGKSIRGLSRTFGISRNTVRRILRKEGEWRYSRGSPSPSPVMDPVRGIIDRWMEEDRGRRKKERQTARRIYTRLVEEYGFTGSERSVRRYVSRRKQALYPRETFLALEHEPGEEMEGDFFHASARIGDQEVELSVFLLVLPCSHAFHAKAYERENRESILDGLVTGYHQWDGVGKVQVLDNTRTVVRKMGRGRHRELDARYLELLAHYAIDTRFCNPGRGNEKSAVENGVRYVRNHFFVPLREFDTLDALNRDLEIFCREHREGTTLTGKRGEISRRFSEEARYLLPLPSRRFDCATRVSTRVGKMATVVFRGHRYSVPDRFTGNPCVIKGYADRVEIWVGNTCIASHRRCYKAGQDALEPSHFVRTLRRKPGAYHHAAVIRRWREGWPEAYGTYRDALRKAPGIREEKEMIEILALEEEYAPSIIAAAMQESLRSRRPLDAETIRRTLKSRETPVSLPPGPPVRLEPYNQLMAKGES